MHSATAWWSAFSCPTNHHRTACTRWVSCFHCDVCGNCFEIVCDGSVNVNPVTQVRLYLAGMWRIVTIDDTFPVHPTSRTIAFSRALRRQLWVPLIEKALAKVAGCYKALEGGSVRRVDGPLLPPGLCTSPALRFPTFPSVGRCCPNCWCTCDRCVRACVV